MGTEKTTLKEFINKPVVKHGAWVLGIVLVSQLFATGLRNQADRVSNGILESRMANFEIIKSGMHKYPSLDSTKLKKLENLLSMLENYKEEKKEVFIQLYGYHFASLTIFMILSSISVVLLLMIAQSGFQNTNPYFKTTFFTLAALATFYGLAPIAFKQEANISKNLTNYLHYENMQHEIYNYALTNDSNSNTTETIPFALFHKKITDQIISINAIDFEFDYKAIPAPNYEIK